MVLKKYPSFAEIVFKKAIKMGSKIAMTYLGNIYFKKGMFDNAEHLFEAASEFNEPLAMTNLAVMYITGQNPSKIIDYKKSLDLYTTAVSLNEPLAFSGLGVMYEFGYGVDKNIKKAQELYKISATKKCSDGIINYVRILQLDDKKCDYKYVYKLLKKAVKMHNISAYFYIGRLYHFGLGVNIDL